MLLQVSKFMRTYGDLDLFPVKVQIPLILSMRITVNVKNICVWSATSAEARATCAKAPAEMCTPPPANFFRAPEGYTRMSLEELNADKLKRREKKKREVRMKKQAEMPPVPGDPGSALLSAGSAELHVAPASGNVFSNEDKVDQMLSK